MPGPIRRRFENSQLLARLLGRIAAGYIRLCLRTGRWHEVGFDELDAALAQGPVFVVCWHGHLVMAPPAWRGRAPVAFPNDPSPAGRLSSATQRHFAITGFSIAAQGDKSGNIGAVRQMMKLARAGHSMGLTADGPKGPDRKVKRAAIEWIRAANLPVFVFAWSARPMVRLHTWDRLRMPLPFCRGTFVFRRWEGDIPKRPDKADMKRLRTSLGAALDTASEIADRSTSAADRPAGPRPGRR